ncbi:hypothetical protein ACLB2K_016081 [Fragaria x ananassa]
MMPFQIFGVETQQLQIMLKPQEKVIAKPGSDCFISGSIEMGICDRFVGIAAPSLARILPIDLAMFGGEILCQLTRWARDIIPGAGGFLRHKLSSQGLAFIIAGGSVVQKILRWARQWAHEKSSLWCQLDHQT